MAFGDVRLLVLLLVFTVTCQYMFVANDESGNNVMGKL